MDANELRIGNIVRGKSDPERRPTKVTLAVLEYPHLFEPIPITPKWLKKAGLCKHKHFRTVFSGESKLSWFHGNNREVLKIKRIDRIFKSHEPWCLWFEWDSVCVHIQYVHQLQNLLFAILQSEEELLV